MNVSKEKVSTYTCTVHRHFSYFAEQNVFPTNTKFMYTVHCTRTFTPSYSKNRHASFLYRSFFFRAAFCYLFSLQRNPYIIPPLSFPTLCHDKSYPHITTKTMIATGNWIEFFSIIRDKKLKRTFFYKSKFIQQSPLCF